MFWIIIASFIVLILLAIIIYFLPAETKAKGKKKAATEDVKDWKVIAERWERNNLSLQGEVEKLKMGDRRNQALVDEQKAQVKEMVEKLALEKSWREKEQQTLEKSKQNEKELKEQVYRTEADLEKEHSSRMRLERELQELKIKYETLAEEKRQLSINSSSQKTTMDAHSQEIRALKSENAKLKEKREDVQWVTKSEFDELKKVLAAKEQELARLKQIPPSQ